MQPDVMPLAITELLHQPELRILFSDLDIRVDDSLAQPFLLLDQSQILIGSPLLAASAESLFHMRHAMELAWLSKMADPALSGLAAARALRRDAKARVDLIVALHPQVEERIEQAGAGLEDRHVGGLRCANDAGKREADSRQAHGFKKLSAR